MTSTPREEWFDRNEILSAISRRVEGFLAGYRQNLALLGPESIGKTTLIKRLLKQEFLGESVAIGLYMEIRAGDSISEWAARFIQTLLYRFLQTRVKKEEALATDPSSLLPLASSWIPRTCGMAKRILHLVESGKSEEVYDLLWDLLYLLTQESGSLAVLALDEFQRLESLGVKDPFRRLGQKIMVHGTIQFLVLSSDIGIAHLILREGLSLLFGKFEIIEIGPLEPSACVKAIRSIWPEGKVDPFLEHLLMELSQRTSGALDLLLQGLVDQRITSSCFDPERILLDLLESLFLDPQGVLRQRFEAKIGTLPTHPNRRTWMEVLTAVSTGKHRVASILQTVDRPLAQIHRALRVLEPAGLVTRQGAFHRIPERLFQLWLRIAYPILQNVELTSLALGRARFRDAASSWLTNVQETIRQPIVEQVSILIRQWEGERMEVDGRQVLLPKFQRVETLLDEPTGMPLILAHRANRSGKSWVFLPLSGSFLEGRARELVQKILRKPFKDYRKVLIGVHPVEMNARLILQEARIRLWDLPVLNRLLDLYGLVGIPLPSEGSVSWVAIDEVAANERQVEGRTG